MVQDVRALAACLLLVAGAGGRGTLAILLTLAKTAGIPPFCPLSCFACVRFRLNMALFRVLRAFSAGFRVLVWVCIISVLCVACVAFVCVSG